MKKSDPVASHFSRVGDVHCVAIQYDGNKRALAKFVLDNIRDDKFGVGRTSFDSANSRTFATFREGDMEVTICGFRYKISITNFLIHDDLVGFTVLEKERFYDLYQKVKTEKWAGKR